MNHIKHVIWDWNGTLVDDSWLFVELMNEELNKRNLTKINIHDYRNHFTFPVKKYYENLGFDFKVLDPYVSGKEDLLNQIDTNLSCLVIQNPSFFGNIQDYTSIANECRYKGVLLIVVVTEPVSLGLIKSPGEMGADIVVGEGQSLAGPSNFGGPGLGFFASLQKYDFFLVP